MERVAGLEILVWRIQSAVEECVRERTCIVKEFVGMELKLQMSNATMELVPQTLVAPLNAFWFPTLPSADPPPALATFLNSAAIMELVQITNLKLLEQFVLQPKVYANLTEFAREQILFVHPLPTSLITPHVWSTILA